MGKLRYAKALFKFYWRAFVTPLVFLALPFIFAARSYNFAPETTTNLHVKAQSPKPSPNCVKKACLALTFDDGPNATSTARILTALEQAHAHASFFLIGRQIKADAAVVERMYQDGDDIGNHTWAHPDLTKLKPAQIRQQIDLTQQAVTALGLPAPHLFRPPYEYLSPTVVKTIQLPIILWNIDPKDWAQPNAKRIVQAVETEAKPGGIVVMHDRQLTAMAVATILHDLKTKYQFVTVSQLLNLPKTAHGIYDGL